MKMKNVTVGTKIGAYEVIAMCKTKILAKSLTDTPEPFVIWDYDSDCVISGGDYYADKMDAEWDFCGYCFDWFADNVNYTPPVED